MAARATDPLVGRHAEVETLDRVLEALQDGSAAGLRVVGEPGIGKTRLMRELSERADAAGHLVLGGRGTEFERHEPFAVLVDALDDFLGSLHPRELERLGAERARELAAVFPALTEVAGEAGPTPLEAERYRTHRAVRALLERLARGRPLVIVLDDLHWADEASVELIAHLVRHPPEAAVLLALAYRPAQAPSTLVAAADQAEREGFGERIELGALPREDADALFVTEMGPERRDELYRESGGNPFYLEQLMRGRWRAETGAADDAAKDVPGAVAAALEQELATLPEAVRERLRAAAVAGEPFDVALAAAAGGVDEAAVLDAIDEALALDLLRPTDVPRRFRFRHPIVRRAVYESAPEGWRVGAHGRVASALAEQGAPAAARAHHVERSAGPGDADAIAVLAEAGHAASARAPGTAVRWFEAALRLLPEGDPKRLEFLAPMATAQGASGRLVESRDTLFEVLATLPPELFEARGRVAAFIARLEHPIGRHGEARAVLRDALAELPDGPSRERVLLTIELAHDHFFLTDFEGMRTFALEALEAARAVEDPLLVAAASADLGMACQNLGRVPEAQAASDEAADILDRLPDDQCAPLLETFWWLGWCEQAIERFAESTRHMRRGIDLSRTTGQGYNFVTLLESLVVPLGWQGKLAEAAEVSQEAYEAALLSGTEQFVAWAEMIRCWLCCRTGDTREAIRWGERALETVGRLTENVFSGLANAHLGAAYLEAGDAGAALAQLLAADEAGAPLEHSVRCWWEVLMTRTQIALGRLDDADEWAERARVSAETMGLPARLGWAKATRAAVDLARGDTEAAITGTREAVALCAEANEPLGTARFRVQLGQALAASGDPDGATRELERARAELKAIGADRYADEAARELRGLGQRVARTGGRGAADAGVASLSAREHEIAELVAAGKTNKEIAAELFLAPKTIENHLSRIFGKLEVKSRAAVASAIGREVAARE